LRYLAVETMRLNSAPPEDGSQVPDIGLDALLLGAGELLYAKHESNLTDDLDMMANLVADFIPIYEIGSITDPFLLFLRFYIYLTIIIPTMPGHLKRGFVVEDLFEREFGFPLKLYYQFVFAFTIHAMNERTNTPVGAVPESGLAISWFNTTALTEEQVSKMFDTVCNKLRGTRAKSGVNQSALQGGV
jgi:hypothetical protein